MGWYLLALLLLLSYVVEGKIRYNSQTESPFQQLADITGNGADEYYTFQGNQVFVTTQEYAVHGMIYLRLPAPAKRIFRGKFLGGTKDLLCAQIASPASIRCYLSNSANTALVQQWTQTDNFILNKDIIVGDYDGDGKDDLLLYTPSTGLFQAYTRTSTAGFAVMTNWKVGGLNGGFTGWQVRAGNFATLSGEGTIARTDIMLYNPQTAAARTFITKKDTDNKFFSNFYFTAFNAFGGVNWEISVPNLDGDAFEDCVLHNNVTGQYLLYNVAPNTTSNKMAVMTSVTLGDLHQGPGCKLFWGKLNFVSASNTNDGGRTRLRDDALVHCPVGWSSIYHRADALLVGTSRKYAHQWSQEPLRLNEDQDRDGIDTIHELGGYDPDNNGVSDGILPSYGASPFVKDIFVEVDYMNGPPGQTWNFSMPLAAISIAVDSFAQKDINLHIFQDNAIPHQSNLGNPYFNLDYDNEWVAYFDSIKNFAATRRPFFHYCIMADSYGNTGSSGGARGIPGQDFMVTMGGYYGGVGGGANPNYYPAAIAGTFLHELGHGLGLRHGGVDNIHRKPNFLSVMNYNYQINGVRKDGTLQYMYSDISCNDITEYALTEPAGVTCDTKGHSYSTQIKGWSGPIVNVNTPIDWDNSGSISATPNSVSTDTNDDGNLMWLPGGYNEYTNFIYTGGQIGSASKKRHPPHEVVYESDEDATKENMPEYVEHDLSEYNIEPHNGSQVLSVKDRWPPQLFSSIEEVLITEPALTYDEGILETTEAQVRERGLLFNMDVINPEYVGFNKDEIL